jgi:drug/metabolite transporter (DMT)-like permease
MTTPTPPARTRSWIFYATLLVLFWGVWGAFSALPATRYGYPDEMIYSIWALTMIIPAVVVLRGQRFDYLIFPIVAVSPAITVLMALGLLRERVTMLAAVGLVAALIAIVLFSISSGEDDVSTGPWLILAIIICVAWGVQAYFMRKAATIGVNDATTFGWMAITALALIPVALISIGGPALDFPWQAPALTAGTQILNAVGALFLVMALSRGKASIVAPTTNALAPALTIIVSLIAYRTLPSVYGAIGIVLALVGSTLMVYSDEKRGEAVTEGALESEAEAAARREHTGS